MPQGCGSGLWGPQSDARYSRGQVQFFLLPFSLNVVPAPAFQRRFLARFHTKSLGVVSHSDGHSIVKVQLRVICHICNLIKQSEKNKKPLHINTNNRRERLVLASNQMLICNGFELIQKTILFLMTQLHLKQYKKFTVASHGILKRDCRRYSGQLPDYASTKTSYSVVVPLRGYFSIHDRTFVCQVVFGRNTNTF